MSHFNLEKAINDATRLDAPMQRGPMMRWQRKALESGVKAISLDSGLNSSGLSAPRSSNSCLSKSPRGKTPRTPGLMQCSPGRMGKKTPSKSGKTPNKSGKTPNKSANNTPHRGTDRFIPNRSAMDTDLAHYALVSGGGSENSDPDTLELSPTSANYQRVMTETLNAGGMPADAKILAFKQKAPEASAGHLNNLKVLYSSGAAGAPSGTKAATTRQIPQQPDRILDAPELLDDYYLNLLSWSSNNHLAIALGTGVYLWNASSGSIVQLLEVDNPDEYVSSLSWIKEGNILAVANSVGNVQLWDIGASKLVRTMTGHASRVGALSWNSYVLSSGSRSGVIHNHDVRQPEHHVGTLAGHTQEVCGLQWSLDGRLLASGANDNLVNIWDANLAHEATPLHTFSHHQAAVKALAWCPWQSNVLATGGGTADRMIRLWNTSTGACLHSVDTNSQVCSLLWCPHYKELISGHGFAQFQLSLWKYPSMSKIADLTGHTARVLSLAMSPDGTTVASAAADETLRMWKCFAVDGSASGAGGKGTTSAAGGAKGDGRERKGGKGCIPLSKGLR